MSIRRAGYTGTGLFVGDKWRIDRPTNRPDNKLHDEEILDGQKGQSRTDWTGHRCWDFQLWIEGRKYGVYWQNNEGHVSLISVLIIPMVPNQIYIPSNIFNIQPSSL
jgi:hypothetical protein